MKLSAPHKFQIFCASVEYFCASVRNFRAYLPRIPSAHPSSPYFANCAAFFRASRNIENPLTISSSSHRLPRIVGTFRASSFLAPYNPPPAFKSGGVYTPPP